MSSLLDLPDEVLFLIGEHFEHDACTLGLFLLIHPRVNAVCASLRYRNKHMRFDGESPLHDYLQHRPWLDNVHNIMVFTACYRRDMEEGYVGRIGYSIKNPEVYDADLAKVITSLASVNIVHLEAPDPPKASPDRPRIPLKETIEAIKMRHEIHEIRLNSFRTKEELELAIDLARALPKCSVLELEQNMDPSVDMDVVTPLLDYLADPSVACRLRKLRLHDIAMLASDALRDILDTLELPPFPLLDTLYMQDEWIWHPDEREQQEFFLNKLLGKASNLVRLDVRIRALLALAKLGSTPLVKILHLQCDAEDTMMPENLQKALPPSLDTLILSGSGATRCAKDLLAAAAKVSSSSFGKAEALIVIEPLMEDRIEELEEMEESAKEKGVSLHIQESLLDNEVDMVNPVNWFKWAPRPFETEDGLLAHNSSGEMMLWYPAEVLWGL